MERRSENRIEVHQTIAVRLFEPGHDPAEGWVVSAGGGGLGAVVSHSLPVGHAVEVELPNCLLVGEVRHCTAQGSMFLVGLDLIQHLTREELDQLLAELGIRRPDRSDAPVPGTGARAFAASDGGF